MTSEDRALRDACSALLGRPIPSHEQLTTTAAQLATLAGRLGMPADHTPPCCSTHRAGLEPAVAAVVALANRYPARSNEAEAALRLIATLPRSALARCCDPDDCGPCCPACQTCPTLDPAYVDLATMHLPPDERPHGRACRFAAHPHGPTSCAVDCPTCHPMLGPPA